MTASIGLDMISALFPASGLGAGPGALAGVLVWLAATIARRGRSRRPLERAEESTLPLAQLGLRVPRLDVEDVVERASAAPFDESAWLRAAVALLEEGREEDGVRYLRRAIWLDPLVIVRLVRSPRCRGVRDKPAVQRLLMEVWRREVTRNYSGYA